MALTNPFTITYGSRAIGGSSDTYLLHGPYVIDKSFNSLRVVFDVVVTADSYSALQTAANNVETDFRKRDQNLVINLSGSTWTYTSGSTILNTSASLSKSGDSETDRGYSRAYTCVVEGELPADDGSPVTGLRDIDIQVDYESGRQKIVTMQGVYTATSSRTATANYEHSTGADGEASTFLSALDSGATFELVDEQFNRDRNNHTCTFTRQYVELLVNQTAGSLDDSKIRDHRVVFTDLSQHPGDSKESVYRTRRVAASYDCSVDIEETTDLQSAFTDLVKDHLISLFQTNFEPKVFCIEDQRVGYDETTKRLSVAIQFLYQRQEGEDIIEISQSLAFRETRNIDYTPVHNGGEFAAYADFGWAARERIATRTVTVVGSETPKKRIGEKPDEGTAGAIEGIEGTKDVVNNGWNITSNTSQVNTLWIGDPNEDQIETTVLTETVVERYTEAPDNRTRAGSGPITGRR